MSSNAQAVAQMKHMWRYCGSTFPSGVALLQTNSFLGEGGSHGILE